MTDPEIRPDVVDLILDQWEYRTLTPEQQARLDSATLGEWVAAAAVATAEGEDFLASANRLEPDELAETLEAAMPPSPIYDGLPDNAWRVLLAQVKWPWDEDLRARVKDITREWSPDARRALEDRFGTLFPDGIHWE